MSIEAQLHQEEQMQIAAVAELTKRYGFGISFAEKVVKNYRFYARPHSLDLAYLRLLAHVIPLVVSIVYVFYLREFSIISFSFWFIAGFTIWGQMNKVVQAAHTIALVDAFFHQLQMHAQSTEIYMREWLNETKNADLINRCFANRYDPPNKLILLISICCFVAIAYCYVALEHIAVAVVYVMTYLHMHYTRYHSQIATAKCLRKISELNAESNRISPHGSIAA